ncbi:MAG: oligosaccharide flippase family protein [Oceanospirillaceae bacterium]|nr:oligosaccharide flippase family protein [Oceanospirillaceae bacterium]
MIVILRKVAGVTGLKVLAAFLLLGFNAQITRSLGAEVAGQFFIVLMWMEILSSLSRLGVDNSVLKINSRANISNEQQSSFFIVSVIASVILSLLFSVSLYFYSTELGAPLLRKVSIFFTLVLIVAFTVVNITSKAMQGRGEVILSQFLLSVATLFCFIILVNLLSIEANFSSYVEIYSLCLGLSATLSLLYFTIKYISPKIDLISSLKLYKSSALPLYSVVIVGLIAQWIGQLTLSLNNSPQEVAIFAVASRASIIVSFLLLAVNSVVAPKYSYFWAEGDKEKLSNLIVLVNRILLLVGVTVFTLILVFSNIVMGLFGEDFETYGYILSILAFGQLVNIVTGSVGMLLIMSDHEREYRYIIVKSTVIFIPVTLILVFGLGLLGAAISTALFIACKNIMCLFSVRKLLKIRLY